MEIPVRFARIREVGILTALVAPIGFVVSSCTAVSPLITPAGMESRDVGSSRGRVTVELVDEYGTQMAGYMVDFSWNEPDFYKTRAFTDRNGMVTFNGVPTTATVSISHEGGLYEQNILVPQRGRSDFRVMVDTRGGYRQRRADELARLNPTSQAR
jgi:hypothetical protein